MGRNNGKSNQFLTPPSYSRELNSKARDNPALSSLETTLLFYVRECTDMEKTAFVVLANLISEGSEATKGLMVKFMGEAARLLNEESDKMKGGDA